jgi:hypothetical protein
MTKQTASWRDVKGVLSEFSHEQLLVALQDLYKLNPATKSFFHSRFLGGAGGVDHLEAYKKRIRNAISTNHAQSSKRIQKSQWPIGRDAGIDAVLCRVRQ